MLDILSGEEEPEQSRCACPAGGQQEVFTRLQADARMAVLTRRRSRVVIALVPLVAVLAALLAAGVLLLLAGANPLQAYRPLLFGGLGSLYGFTETLVKATPLLLVGLGIVIAFRGGMLNIGGEGQMVLGAVVGTWVALQMGGWPGWLGLSVVLAMGFMAGAAWGFIPGILKARLGVNEILSTIMLNQIALQALNYLLRGPMIDPTEVAYGTGYPQSAPVPEQLWLWRLLPPTRLHLGAGLALLLAAAVYAFLWRTTIGYRLRAVGTNPKAARYGGIRVTRYLVLAMALSGGFAGLAGIVEVLGIHHRVLDGVTAGYGFSGIVAALFGKLHPLGAIPASVLFGALLVGADMMQRAVGVPAGMVNAVQGLVVIFVVSSEIWTRQRARARED